MHSILVAVPGHYHRVSHVVVHDATRQILPEVRVLTPFPVGVAQEHAEKGAGDDGQPSAVEK